jgi:hypothetical protein
LIADRRAAANPAPRTGRAAEWRFGCAAVIDLRYGEPMAEGGGMEAR